MSSQKSRSRLPWAALALLACVAGAACGDPEEPASADDYALDRGWLDFEYARQVVVPLGSGVTAILGGGGNSLLVEGSKKAMLVDTKVDLPLAPGASRLHSLVTEDLGVKVTDIVLTHFHYDHSWGASLYPGATVHAHTSAREDMLSEDPDFWNSHATGLPTAPHATQHSVNLGGREVKIEIGGRGHTEGDLWVYVPEANVVVTGDVLFHTYYPFFDETEAGSSLAGISATLRRIAAMHPTARVVPGHGPVCTMSDVLAYADFMDALIEGVDRAIADGMSEAEAVDAIDLSRFDLKVLPSFHHGRLTWATSDNTIRSAYRIRKRSPRP